MLWVARRSGGLKAGAGRATASGGCGLDPARSPVLRTTMRSVEDRARKRRSLSSPRSDLDPTSAVVLASC